MLKVILVWSSFLGCWINMMGNLNAIWKKELILSWIRLITIIEEVWAVLSPIIKISHLPSKDPSLSYIKICGTQV